MEAVGALAQLGGSAHGAALRRLTPRRVLRRAVREGEVLRPRRGCYALPVLDAAHQAVLGTGGVRSHLSAALHYGWALKTAPPQPMITIGSHQRLDGSRRAGMQVFWRAIEPEERLRGVTTPVRTVIDCARDLPFDEALSVADSALRSGLMKPRDLGAAAASSPRTGRSKAVAVAQAADARAANPFESVLRAIALEVPGLRVEPQLTVAVRDAGDLLVLGRVDLADLAAGLIIEAESWEHHGGREGFRRDVRRYTSMVRAGWLVVRFGWDEVMHQPDEVRAVLVDTLACAHGHQPERLVHRGAA